MDWWSEDVFGNECWSLKLNSIVKEPCETVLPRITQKNNNLMIDNCKDEGHGDGSVIVLDSDSSTDPCDATFPVIKKEIDNCKDEDDRDEGHGDGSVIVLDSDSSTDPCDATFPVIKKEKMDWWSEDVFGNECWSLKHDIIAKESCETVLPRITQKNNNFMIRDCKYLDDCTRSKVTADSGFVGESCALTFPKLEAKVKCEAEMDNSIIESSVCVSNNGGSIHDLHGCEVTEKSVEEVNNEMMIVTEPLASNRSEQSTGMSSSSEPRGNGTLSCMSQNCDVSKITIDPASAAKLPISNHLESEIPPTRRTVTGGCSQTGVKPFSCSLCTDKFSNRFTLRQHIITHKLKNMLSSSVHTSMISYKNSTKRSTYSVIGKNLFSCSLCKKIFSSKNSIVAHIRSHTDETPFSCFVCNAKFSLKGDLNEHLLSHSSHKAFSSSLRSAAFSQKNHANKRTRKRTGKKKFPCSACPAEYSHERSLVSHMKKHASKKQFLKKKFLCSVCTKKYSYKHGLKRHMKKHTGTQLSSRTVCRAKKFREGDVNPRKLKYTNKKQFSCSICSAQYIHYSSLYKHMKNHRS